MASVKVRRDDLEGSSLLPRDKDTSTGHGDDDEEEDEDDDDDEEDDEDGESSAHLAWTVKVTLPEGMASPPNDTDS